MNDKSVTKLVIFDDSEECRSSFEEIYPKYKDRITLYEGNVETNLEAYFKLRKEDGILPEMHRLEIVDNNLFTIA
jgi:hypothetical protein